MIKTKKLVSIALTMALAVSASFMPAVNAAGVRTVTPKVVTHEAATGMDKNQFLNINNADDPPTLDSTRTTDQISFRVLTNLMEGLVRQEITPSGQSVAAPGGAEKYTISPDGKVWTFYLRKHNWSDGKQVTASDYEFAWKRLLDPKNASEYAYFLYFVKGAEEYSLGKGKVTDVGIKAVNATTFQVTLKRPTAYFEKILAFDILLPLRKDIATKGGDAYGQDPKKMVFNGPYVVESFIRGGNLVLKKNSKFWDAKHVYMNKITFKNIKELATSIQMFEQKQLDRVQGSKDWLAKLQSEAKQGKFKYFTGIDPVARYWQFQTQKGVFKNAKVRLAFGLSVNREQYTKTILRRRIPLYSLVPKGIMHGDKEFRALVGGSNAEPIRMMMKKYPNAAAWKKLLQEGLKELGMSTDTSKVTVNYLQNGADALSRQYAEYYKDQWEKALGVNVKLNLIAEFGQYLNATKTGNYEFTMAGWGPDYNDPMTYLDMFTTGNDMNKAFWSNKTFDALIKKAQNETDMKKRTQELKDAEYLICTQAAIVPFITDDVHAFQQNYVHNVQFLNFGGDFDFKYTFTKGATSFESARTR